IHLGDRQRVDFGVVLAAHLALLAQIAGGIEGPFPDHRDDVLLERAERGKRPALLLELEVELRDESAERNLAARIGLPRYRDHFVHFAPLLTLHPSSPEGEPILVSVGSLERNVAAHDVETPIEGVGGVRTRLRNEVQDGRRGLLRRRRLRLPGAGVRLLRRRGGEGEEAGAGGGAQADGGRKSHVSSGAPHIRYLSEPSPGPGSPPSSPSSGCFFQYSSMALRMAASSGTRMFWIAASTRIA